MPDTSLLLWDVGGVVLSNAWDHPARTAATVRFHLEPNEFERRHAEVVDAFEEGRMDLDAYLSRTVFYVPRLFTPQAFFDFMCSCSKENAAALACARAIRATGRYVTVALNNESRELNGFRIERFHLRDSFHAFFSSCYTGFRKPDLRAYQFALRVTQRDPSEALFLDDRPENVEAAARLGVRTLQVRDPDRLHEALTSCGISFQLGPEEARRTHGGKDDPREVPP